MKEIKVGIVNIINVNYKDIFYHGKRWKLIGLKNALLKMEKNEI